MGVENIIGYGLGSAIVGGPVASVITLAWLSFRQKDWSGGKRIAKIVAWNFFFVFLAECLGKIASIDSYFISIFSLIGAPALTVFAMDGQTRPKPLGGC